MAGQKKITEEQKKQIKTQFESGVSKYRIAKNHGISETMVRYIVDPEKLDLMRQMASKRGTEKAKNNIRVARCRERKKNNEW